MHSNVQENTDSHLQVRDAWRLHFSQSSSVCSEGGGAVNQRAIFLQSLREIKEQEGVLEKNDDTSL